MMKEPVEKLGAKVQTYLRTRGRKTPALSILRNLLSIAIEASLRSEEGSNIRCILSYVDPLNPYAPVPNIVRAHRWVWTELDEPILLTSRSLSKLALAMPPYAATIGVYRKSERELIIWGFSDQELHHYNGVNREGDGGFLRAGIIQIEISGIGSIAVFDGSTRIGGIQLGELERDSINALSYGPLSKKLQSFVVDHIVKIESEPGIYNNRKSRKIDSDFKKFIGSFWRRCLARLLLNIRRQRHGGAVLFSRNSAGLKAKYRIHYVGLEKSMVRYSAYTLDSEKLYERIRSSLEMTGALNQSLHYEEAFVKRDLEDALLAVSGAVTFVSSLSRVDGLIQLSNGFEVCGFGVEILTETDPKKVYVARDTTGKVENSRKVDIQVFGTRHRSMIRYCALHPESVGFVISQDGDVRAITQLGGRIVIWENIKLQDADAF